MGKSGIPYFPLDVELDEKMELIEMCIRDRGKARAGTLDDEEFGQFVRASTEFNDVPIYIDDSGSATVPEIRARCMRFSGKEKKNLGLVIIDYLQLMSATQQSRAGSRTQEISELTRQLKLLARDLKAPILLLSPVSYTHLDVYKRQILKRTNAIYQFVLYRQPMRMEAKIHRFKCYPAKPDGAFKAATRQSAK